MFCFDYGINPSLFTYDVICYHSSWSSEVLFRRDAFYRLFVFTVEMFADICVGSAPQYCILHELVTGPFDTGVIFQINFIIQVVIWLI